MGDKYFNLSHISDDPNSVQPWKSHPQHQHWIQSLYTRQRSSEISSIC